MTAVHIERTKVYVAADDDTYVGNVALRRDVIAKDAADYVGNIVASKYPGYRWYVKPIISKGQLDVIELRCLHANGSYGVYLNPDLSMSETDWRRTIVMKAGEILEHFNLSRRKFSVHNWMDALSRKNHAGLILPDM